MLAGVNGPVVILELKLLVLLFAPELPFIALPLLPENCLGIWNLLFKFRADPCNNCPY